MLVQQPAAAVRNPSGGMCTPLPWMGSMMSAATSPLRSSAASASRSPSGIEESGSSGSNPRRNSAEPFTDSEPVVSPWKAWSQ